jgi:hypothetical protein
MDLGSTFVALLGPVEVNQILRVPQNDVSSYEVIQLGHHAKQFLFITRLSFSLVQIVRVVGQFTTRIVTVLSLTQRYAKLRKADSRIEDAWVELKVFLAFASATARSPPGLDQNFDGRY